MTLFENSPSSNQWSSACIWAPALPLREREGERGREREGEREREGGERERGGGTWRRE